MMAPSPITMCSPLTLPIIIVREAFSTIGIAELISTFSPARTPPPSPEPTTQPAPIFVPNALILHLFAYQEGFHLPELRAFGCLIHQLYILSEYVPINEAA